MVYLFPNGKGDTSYTVNTDNCRLKSMVVSVEAYFSFQLSSRFLNADRPSSCGMFGYNPTTSIVYKIMPSDNFGGE